MKAWLQAVGFVLLELLVASLCPAAETTPCDVALAYPVEGITIDGDLSDWPAGLRRYPIVLKVFGTPRNAEDCSADFRIGYHEKSNALYLAFEVQDADEEEPNDDSVKLWNSDSVMVIIALPREGADPLILGFLRGTSRLQTITISGYGDATYWPPQYFEAKVQVRGGRRFYEFRIDLEASSKGRIRLRPNQKLEVSSWVYDVDQKPGGEQSTVLGWVYGNSARPRSGRGEVLLVRAGELVGRLSGQVKWADGSKVGTPKRVRIEGEKSPALIVHTLTDRRGRFAVDLPVGSYRVALAERGQEAKPAARVTVRTTAEATVELRAWPVTGLETAAEPGRVQKAGRGIRRGQWRTYGIGDGLPAATVRAIAQDRQGELWLGTEDGGLARFDGARFVTYATEAMLGSSTISRIAEDPRGNLWFTADPHAYGRGIAWLDRERRWFHVYTQEDGLIRDGVGDIVVDQNGKVCFAMDGGVGRFEADRGQFVQFTVADGLPTPFIQSVTSGRMGHLWVNPMFSQQFCSWEGEKFNRYSFPSGWFCDHLLEDRSGRLWAAAEGTGTNEGVYSLWRYDGQGWKPFPEEPANSGRLPEVTVIYEDHAGNIWLGTSSGLLRFREGRFEDFGAATGLGPGRVYAIQEDQEGRLWIGVGGGGLKVLDPAWVTYTATNGLPHSCVTALAEWQGRMVVGTQGGLSRLGSAGFEAIPAFTNAWINQVLADRQGGLWIAHGTNLTLLGSDARPIGTNEIRLRDVVPSSSFRDLTLDGRGNLWLLPALRGLARFDGRGLTSFTTVDGLADNLTSCLCADEQNGLWVGTSGHGVSYYDGTNFHTYNRASGLAGDFVTAIARGPGGVMWLGTTRGLSRYDGQRWRTFTRTNGLPADHITTLLPDRSGKRLWIGTAAGGVAVYDAERNVVQAWSWRDGLSHDTINTLFQDRDGSLWVGTDNGLTHYRPHTNAPAIRLTGITTDRALDPAKPVRLAGRPRRVLFEFEGVSLKTHPDDMAYLCQLAGHEASERAVYDGRIAYADLPYGEYEFRIRAVDQDLNASVVAVVPLVIRPDYQQLGLVGGLGLAVAGGLIASGIALKHRRERNRALVERAQFLEAAKESAESAREAAVSANRAKSAFLANMSHEIRTPMNAILGYSQILQRAVDLPEDHRAAVETIAKSGDHLLALINDVLDLSKIEAGRMELHPVDFDLNALVNDLAAMFQIRCRQKGLRFSAECGERGAEGDPGEKAGEPPVLQGRRVRGDQGKLRQVLINLLSNAVKFTEEGKVVLRVLREVGAIKTEVRNPKFEGLNLKSEIRNPKSAMDPSLLPSVATTDYLFEVVDTGVGIAPEVQAQIFEPFRQGQTGERKEGTGLGLAIARRHVELMGGDLRVESRSGAGSRFYFVLPLALAEETPLSALSEAGVRGLRLAAGVRVKALVVDDVRENRDVLCRLLADIGCEVASAEDGLQGVEMGCAMRPDIVFLDIRMPVMDGLEAALKLRAHFQSAAEGSSGLVPRLVSLSASALAHEQERYLAAGFDDFVAKPFRLERLYDCLARVPGVRFEPAAFLSRTNALPEAVDLMTLRLPAELRSRLRSAAKLYRTTELKGCIGSVQELGAQAAPLAARLRALNESGDMTAMLELLEALEKSAERAEEPS